MDSIQTTVIFWHILCIVVLGVLWALVIRRRNYFPLNAREPFVLHALFFLGEAMFVFGALRVVSYLPCFVSAVIYRAVIIAYSICYLGIAFYIILKRKVNAAEREQLIQKSYRRTRFLLRKSVFLAILIVHVFAFLLLVTVFDPTVWTKTTLSESECMPNATLSSTPLSIFGLYFIIVVIVMIVIFLRMRSTQDTLHVMRDLKITGVLCLIGFSIWGVLSFMNYIAYALLESAVLTVCNLYGTFGLSVYDTYAEERKLRRAEKEDPEMSQSQFYTKAFEEMMKNPTLRAQFEDFTRSIWCIENLFLYEELLQYKSNPSLDQLVEIYHKYIADDAVHQANLTASNATPVKELVAKIKDGTVTEVPDEGFLDSLFDEVKRTIITDSFRRFHLKINATEKEID